MVSAPRCVGRTEVSIDMEIVDFVQGFSYVFEYKQPHEKWDDALSVVAQHPKATLDDLNPTCTYHIRVKATAPGTNTSEYSQEVAVDTEVPGCTPSPTCAIL
ncbi:hypothetical protein THRCLA_21045 [Thraustotheca clavata]|uniref:Fibronectin type-III domain-containing protein n=1 Tax=Thraustotheca clavata TaxID=74557 RepID=A0A1W0A0R2_9STRA|nr:hypothetical protein THRCLA_21045 [Thraustotheca clavata]